MASRWKLFRSTRFVWLVVWAHCMGAANAFQVSSDSAFANNPRHETTRKLHLTFPVHEGLTHAAMHAAEHIQARCGAKVGPLSPLLGRSIVQGSVWNDDPLRYLPANEHDWLVSYLDGDTRNGIDYQFDHMYQSHFGPLQFLHAMAGQNQDVPAAILMWSELVFRIGRGEFTHATKFSEVRRGLSPASAIHFDKLFFRPRSGWNLGKLFLDRCNSTWSAGWFGKRSKLACQSSVRDAAQRDEVLKGVATGSLLHIVQDSYSPSHVSRGNQRHSGELAKLYNAGAIRLFKNYKDQDGVCHGKSDRVPPDEPHIACLERAVPGCPPRAMLLDGIVKKVQKNLDNPIGIGAEIISCVLPQNPAATSWDTFRVYMEKTVLISEADVPSHSEACPRSDSNPAP